jgi:D-3-phosphoglycerate dehydrogenase
VRALGHAVEIELAPRMLVIENADVPGMVGRVGTLLGDGGVNIANMNLSREGAGAQSAVMVLSIDSDPSPAVLAALAKSPGVHGRPRVIRLG